MKKFLSFAIPLAVYIASFIIMFSLRSVPATQIWQEYFIAYTPVSVPEQDVLVLCEKSGISNIISLSGNSSTQKKDSIYNIVSNFNGTYSNFNSGKEAYFSDITGKYRIFYIPLKYKENIKKVESQLQGKLKTETQDYPLVPFIVVLISAVLIISTTRKKTLQIFLSLPFVFYVLCSPYYISAAVSSVLLYIVSLLGNIYLRKNAAKAIFRNCFIVFLVAVSLVAIFLNCIQSFLLFILSIVSCLSVLLFIISIKREKAKKAMFVTVPIISAFSVNVTSYKALRSLLIPLFSIAICLISAFSGKNFSVRNDDEYLSIPTPTEYTKKHDFSVSSYEEVGNKKTKSDLPDLTLWISDYWKEKVFMYCSLYSESGFMNDPIPGDCIIIPSYYDSISENGENKISTYDDVKFCFDDSFITSSVDTIKANNGFVENLLVSQNGFESVSYENMNGRNNTTRLTIIELVWLLFMIAPIIIKSGIKGVFLKKQIVFSGTACRTLK